MWQKKLWIKILILTNILTFSFLTVISLHYQVPQKVLNKIGLIKFESSTLTATARYTYIDYRQSAIHSLVNGNAGFEIVMLGDSITAGGDWDALFNRVDVANFGIGGDTTSYLLYRLSDVYLANPQKCFLMIGINDFAGNDTVDNVFNNYISIIKNIKSHNIEPFIQSTLYLSETASKFPHIGNNWKNINIQVDNLNKLLYKYCSDNNLTYINLNKTLSKDKILEEENTPDGVHLNKTGYEKWKNIVVNYI